MMDILIEVRTIRPLNLADSPGHRYVVAVEESPGLPSRHVDTFETLDEAIESADLMASRLETNVTASELTPVPS
jgi:hypothetical protein